MVKTDAGLNGLYIREITIILSPFLFAIYLDDLTRSPLLTRGMFIVLYADDILLVSPSVCMPVSYTHLTLPTILRV